MNQIIEDYDEDLLLHRKFPTLKIDHYDYVLAIICDMCDCSTCRYCKNRCQLSNHVDKKEIGLEKTVNHKF